MAKLLATVCLAASCMTVAAVAAPAAAPVTTTTTVDSAPGSQAPTSVQQPAVTSTAEPRILPVLGSMVVEAVAGAAVSAALDSLFGDGGIGGFFSDLFGGAAGDTAAETSSVTYNPVPRAYQDGADDKVVYLQRDMASAANDYPGEGDADAATKCGQLCAGLDWCYSFDIHALDGRCNLSATTVKDIEGGVLVDDPDWDYYEYVETR